MSMQQKIQPTVQQHVPFFSANQDQNVPEGMSKNPSSEAMDSFYHDDPLKNQMIRQRTKSKARIPI
jgi:hypothetical protein